MKPHYTKNQYWSSTSHGPYCALIHRSPWRSFTKFRTSVQSISHCEEFRDKNCIVERSKTLIIPKTFCQAAGIW